MPLTTSDTSSDTAPDAGPEPGPRPDPRALRIGVGMVLVGIGSIVAVFLGGLAPEQLKETTWWRPLVTVVLVSGFPCIPAGVVVVPVALLTRRRPRLALVVPLALGAIVWVACAYPTLQLVLVAMALADLPYI